MLHIYLLCRLVAVAAPFTFACWVLVMEDRRRHIRALRRIRKS